jgi:hypothetical protein
VTSRLGNGLLICKEQRRDAMGRARPRLNAEEQARPVRNGLRLKLPVLLNQDRQPAVSPKNLHRTRCSRTASQGPNVNGSQKDSKCPNRDDSFTKEFQIKGRIMTSGRKTVTHKSVHDIQAQIRRSLKLVEIIQPSRLHFTAQGNDQTATDDQGHHTIAQLPSQP